MLEMFDAPAHSMGEVPDASVDVVISNAVLEHVGQLPQAARELFRITAAGGEGFHRDRLPGIIVTSSYRSSTCTCSRLKTFSGFLQRPTAMSVAEHRLR